MTGVRWNESFAGTLALGGVTDFNQALMPGVGRDAQLEIDVSLADLDEWIRDPSYGGRAEGGTLTCAGLPGDKAIVDGGDFQLFVPANGKLSDALHLRLRYTLALHIKSTDEALTLHAFKLIENNPGLDAWYDSTTLFTRIYRGADVPVDADDSQLLAVGVLRITLPRFIGQMLSFSALTSGADEKSNSAVARYQLWFLRRLTRAYVGPPVNLSRPSFPIDHPQPDWDCPQRELKWHSVPGRPQIERKVYPFAVEDLDFPLNVQRLRLSGHGADANGSSDKPGLGPVLLIPGSGVRANMFYGQPVGETLAERLLGLGYDVWVENWRASIDFPPNSYTLDQAARIDHPDAVKLVLRESRAKKLRAVVHCQGSVSFLMACTAGYLDGKVSHVVSSAVSLFVDVRWPTWVKQRVAVPIVQLATPWADAQWGLRADTSVGRVFGVLGKRLERPCDNPACQVANFMYGSGWDTLLLHEDPQGRDWIDPDVHDWSARELGATPMSFLDQICASSNYGHVVAAQPRDPLGPANYLARPNPEDLPPAPERPHFTFIAGDQNRMFRWQGQQKAADFMREFHGCRSDFVGLPGFGHLDTIWGIEAPKWVFPVIVDGLEWDGDPNDAPKVRADARGEKRELNERWPERRGRLASAWKRLKH
jgi:hypothetical protein